MIALQLLTKRALICDASTYATNANKANQGEDATLPTIISEISFIALHCHLIHLVTRGICLLTIKSGLLMMPMQWPPGHIC